MINKKHTIYYHSSNIKIEYPGIKKEKNPKIFSWEFYCTEIKEQAIKDAK